MKKFLLTTALSLAVLALVWQPAQAWKSASFGIGMNFSYASGNNSFGWGLWQNGQAPTPGGFGGGFGGGFPYGPTFPPTPYAPAPFSGAPGYDFYPGQAMTPAASPFMPASYPGYGYGSGDFSYYGQ